MSEPLPPRSRAAAGPDMPYLVPDPEAPTPLVTESGFPDPATFPVERLAELYGAVLREETAHLQYGTLVDGELLYGPVGLRSLLAERNVIGGNHGDARSVMLTAGAAPGISAIVRAFVDPGDVVAVEQPSWDYVLRDLAMVGADVRPVPLGLDGLDLDALEALLDELAAEGRRLRLLYTIPTFNVPTGVVMSGTRRERLVELAARHGFLVLEDDVYTALRYSGEPQPTLQSLDPSGHVLRVDSFSKTISPALRLGWVSGHPELLSAVGQARRDLGVSHLNARVVHRFMASGEYDDHVVEVRAVYREKRDRLVAALAEHSDGLVRCRPPEGGFFLWLEPDASVDVEAMRLRAASEGVVCRAGSRFGEGSGLRPGMRLSFTEPSLDVIDRVAEVLGEAARASRTVAGADR